MKKSKKTTVYDVITNRIIDALENGSVPWQKPWDGGAFRYGDFANYSSKKPYRGINALLTALGGFSSPYFLTFKQAKELGGCVRKGEHGTPIVFWNTKEIENDKGEKEEIFFARYYTVFNLTQVEGIEFDPKDLGEAPKVIDFKPIKKAESLVKGYKSCPEIRHNQQRAFYVPSQDYVNMPQKDSFKGSEEYYSTLFHELTHSTGHKSRLNRSSMNKVVAAFGSHDYSKEELVAEMGSAFLCSIAGISQPVIENQAAYIRSWLKVLKNDSRMVVDAAQNAQKAVDHILGE